MAGKKGHSGPPGNADAFRHGLAALQHRRADISAHPGISGPAKVTPKQGVNRSDTNENNSIPMG
jgi:hypothetical protein